VDAFPVVHPLAQSRVRKLTGGESVIIGETVAPIPSMGVMGIVGAFLENRP
jgi:hypothetical protein